MGCKGIYIIRTCNHDVLVLLRENLCFRAKIRKNNVYHCKPQFYYIKVGCKGVFITRTCFRDEEVIDIDIDIDIETLFNVEYV